MMGFQAALALAVLGMLALGAVDAQDDRAHLLVQKATLTNRAFAGKDLPIRYRIFNVGSGPAYDVTFEDDWSAEEFESISGLTSGSWASIPAGANISHIVVIRPFTYGYKGSSPAKITYKHSEDSEEVQVAYSNDDLLPVLSSKEDDKLSAAHVTEWVCFLGMSLALVLLPVVLFRPPQSDAKKAKKA